jgi:hypothetical protein
LLAQKGVIIKVADSYSYDMQRLQQDAIRRAREMQARAQNYSAPHQDPAPVRPAQNAVPAPPPPPEQTRRIPPNEPPKHAPPHEPPKPPEHGDEPPKGPLGSIGGIFQDLMKDSERTLILVLILLLVEDKSDPEVIFALMYLIL